MKIQKRNDDDEINYLAKIIMMTRRITKNDDMKDMR